MKRMRDCWRWQENKRIKVESQLYFPGQRVILQNLYWFCKDFVLRLLLQNCCVPRCDTHSWDIICKSFIIGVWNKFTIILTLLNKTTIQQHKTSFRLWALEWPISSEIEHFNDSAIEIVQQLSWSSTFNKHNPSRYVSHRVGTHVHSHVELSAIIYIHNHTYLYRSIGPDSEKDGRWQDHACSSISY